MAVKGDKQAKANLIKSLNAVPKSVWQQTDKVFAQTIKDPNASKKALATRFAISEFKLNKWTGSEVNYRDVYKWVWLEKYMFVDQSYSLNEIKKLGEQLLAGQQKYLTELGLIVANTGEILENQTVIIEQNGTILATTQEITTSLTGIQTSIGEIQTAIATIQTNVGEINANLVTIKDGVQYLITEVGLIRDDVSLIRTELGFIKDGIEFIKTDVGFIKNDISIIKNDLGFIKDGIQYIKTELGYIRQTVDEIKVIATETLGTVKENQEILNNMQQNGVKFLDKRNSGGGGGGFDFTQIMYVLAGIVVLALVFKFLKSKK